MICQARKYPSHGGGMLSINIGGADACHATRKAKLRRFSIENCQNQG
jgi:hypothetical protein